VIAAAASPRNPPPNNLAVQADYYSKMGVEFPAGESFNSGTCAYTVLMADVFLLTQPPAQTAIDSMAHAPVGLGISCELDT